MNILSKLFGRSNSVVTEKGEVDRHSAWVQEQVAKIEELSGTRVTEFLGTEMALTEDPVRFEDPSIPFIQLGELILKRGKLPALHFITYQNDDNWGLVLDQLRDERLPPEEMPITDGIYRTRSLTEISLGMIQRTSTKLDDRGDIMEVHLVFEGSQHIVLLAGEVYETAIGLRTLRHDESVLLFKSPQDLEKFSFHETII